MAYLLGGPAEGQVIQETPMALDVSAEQRRALIEYLKQHLTP